MQPLNDQKLSFFRKKRRFCEKSLKDFRSPIWHFLLRLRVRRSYCFGTFETIKFLGFFGKIDVVFGKIFFSEIGKRGIFLLACVSNSINAQENWKRSTAGDFRESRWVIQKNWLIFLKRVDISNVSIECVSNGFFA